jgi:hypothetical protein
VTADELDLFRRVREAVERVGRRGGAALWPGFRPDTLPVAYAFRDRGRLLLGWEGALPDGYVAIEGVAGAGWQSEGVRSAASTGMSIEGRGTAQVVYSGQELPWLVGTSIHEAFHVYQGAMARGDRHFGRGENSFLVTRYPIFDVENETAFALEGIVLTAAVDAKADSTAARLAREYLSVREARQRRLGAELAEFEQQAELNEGLAQYAGVKALLFLSEMRDVEWPAEAAAEAQRERGKLEGFLDERDVSFRQRYYATGVAQALLLDRLAGDDWKEELMEQNLTLQDALALAGGYRERERALRRSAREEFDAERLTGRAELAIEDLRARLRARVDSALSRPGLTLVMDATGINGVGLCGIDPQNLLQVDEGVLFHSRWVRPCAGQALQAEFTTPVLEDRTANTLRAVIGPLTDVHVSVNGEPLRLTEPLSIHAAEGVHLEAPDATVTAARADIELSGDTLRIRPLGG